MSFDSSPVALATLYADVSHRLALSANAGMTNAMAAVAEAAVQVVPGTEFASITKGSNGRFTTVGQTDPDATRADAIQYELNSGPCVDAAVEDRVFRTGDLAHDKRWPEFGPRAHDAVGICSMLSFRLYFEDDAVMIAALNLYSKKPDAFDTISQTVGMVVATHGALAIVAARANEKAANLTVALESNREIGVAMGIIMSRHMVTRDQAFDLLRIASQNSNRKMAEIAADVADTGALDLPTPRPR